MPKTRIDDPLTAAQLRAVLDYDPDTGLFRWRPRMNCRPEWNTRYAGKVAGTPTKYLGYIQIGIYGRLYLAQRLAWLWMTGEWSASSDLDHRDTDTTNNRWSNLREATSSQNKMNVARRSDNTSGYKGVSLDKRRNKWVAEVMIGKKTHYLGQFDTAEEAHAARTEAATRLHLDFARFE
jgi:HNH endonuclease/AP2 domain